MTYDPVKDPDNPMHIPAYAALVRASYGVMAK